MVTNGLAQLIVHGTVEDTAYEVLSRETLTNTAWASEGIVIGAAGQDWTPTAVAVLARTNALFLWARSWADTDGDGLPDWWEMEHGLDPHNPDTGDTGVSDGYKDSDNDGWTNLQEYQNGTSPNSFDTPPAPQALTVTLIAGGAHANLQWPPAAGPVTGYTIERSFTNVTTQVSGSTTYFADTGYTLPTGLYFTVPRYRLQAHYGGGNSQWGPWTSSPQSLAPAAAILSGGSSQVLVVAAMPTASEASALRAGQWYTSYPEYSITNVNLPVTNFTNGVTAMPEPFAALTSTGAWYLQWVYPNGVAGAAIPVGSSPTIPFWDGREQLKQNLIFLLRAATVNDSFGYTYDDGFFAPYFLGSPTAYAYASFFEAEDYFGTPDAYLAELWPYEENHRYRNFAFSVTNLNSNGTLNTGVYWDVSYDVTLDYLPLHQFAPPANPTAIPALLSSAQSQWLYWTEFMPWSGHSAWEEIGITYQEPDFLMANGARNLFGLPYESVKLAWGDSGADTATLSAGGSIPGYAGIFYPETAQPIFETLDYYFGRPWIDWLPGHDGFSPTNLTPLLVAPVGQTIQLAGYAKLALANGYTNKFGYLGQYFDKALKMTNGVATTNVTGILSPYGEFFPTEPGPTALVTMPDLDTGERGTGVVHVIKLQSDVNHDGVMDLAFGGPDNTSPVRPFVFWANNDRDDLGSGGNPDRDVWLPPNGATNNNDYSFGQIRTMRNLEDFTRLWICGMPTLPTNQNYSVQIGWSQIESGAPKLRLYRASETDGGIGYLTNITTASLQIIDYNYPVGEVTPTSSLSLPTSWFTNSLNRYFLFEAGGIGKGALTLTISQGTNVIAQTSAWMDFHDIRDFYEEVAVTSVIQTWPEMVQTNLNSDFKVVRHSTAGIGDAKQMAVFVHGWRMPYSDFEVFSQTMFKRLYWQGYQGKFATVRWSTRSSDTDPDGLDYATYNRSEYISFQSATGTALYLYDLRDRLSDYTISVCSHSQGGILMMEALAELAASSESPLDHYVMMETAVPAHCYDPAVTNLPALVNMEQSIPTPNTYLNYASTITNALRGGKVINFFNPVDFALASGLGGTGLGSWENNQELLKPLVFFGYLYIATNQTAYVISNQFTGAFGITNLQNRIVTDPLELMPFVARPRSKAVGAQAGVGNVVNGPEYNLQSQLGFTAATYDHSGQFNRNIQTPQVQGFYFNLLRALTEGEL